MGQGGRGARGQDCGQGCEGLELEGWGWRDGGMEGWGWRDGEMEGWRDGGMKAEGHRSCRAQPPQNAFQKDVQMCVCDYSFTFSSVAGEVEQKRDTENILLARVIVAVASRLCVRGAAEST